MWERVLDWHNTRKARLETKICYIKPPQVAATGSIRSTDTECVHYVPYAKKRCPSDPGRLLIVTGVHMYLPQHSKHFLPRHSNKVRTRSHETSNRARDSNTSLKMGTSIVPPCERHFLGRMFSWINKISLPHGRVGTIHIDHDSVAHVQQLVDTFVHRSQHLPYESTVDYKG